MSTPVQPGTVYTTTTYQTPVGYTSAPSDPGFGVHTVPANTVTYTTTTTATPVITTAHRPAAKGSCIKSILPLIALVCFQILMGFLYGFRVVYSANLYGNYHMYQDINVIIFVAIGFLFSFLRYHGWSVLSFSLLIASICLQLFILVGWFWTRVFDGLWSSIFYGGDYVVLDMGLIIVALHSAASALVSYGALAGKLNIGQAIFLAFLHNWIYGLNRGLIEGALDVRDAGGSIKVFLFGGVFGIAASITHNIGLTWPRPHPKHISSYESNIFAFIGTLFVFVYFPSFNAGLTTGNPSVWASFNTAIAIASSVIGTFAITPLLHGGKLCIETVLNASIAGGVALGASAFLIGNLFLPVVFGFFAGVIAAIGFRFLSPRNSSYGFYDTSGVLHTFLIPGFLGGIYSAFLAAKWNDVVPLAVRSNSAQGGIQVACVFITIGIALVGGLITGFILKLLRTDDEPYEDFGHWELEHKR